MPRDAVPGQGTCVRQLGTGEGVGDALGTLDRPGCAVRRACRAWPQDLAGMTFGYCRVEPVALSGFVSHSAATSMPVRLNRVI